VSKKRALPYTAGQTIAIRLHGATFGDVEIAARQLREQFGSGVKLGPIEGGVGGALVGGYSAYGTLMLSRALTEGENLDLWSQAFGAHPRPKAGELTDERKD
jgi:hypothetical protein